jgi:hypothetical protein
MEQNKICCPEFNPLSWDNKFLEWNNKKFIKDKVFTFFYFPLNFGPKIVKNIKMIEQQNAVLDNNMCLSDHTSRWNMDIYLPVDKEISGATNVTISGKFLSKVYEGSFTNTDKWCLDFKNYAKNQNLNIKKWYMWYTTCPKCAKKYGKNYVVILGEVE